MSMGMIDTLRRPAPAATFDEVLAETRAALEALDFSDKNAEIAELDGKIAKIGDAIESAKQRAAQLRDEEEEARSNSRAVAQALLNGTDPDQVMSQTSSGVSVKERRAALLAAVPELSRDRADAVRNREGIAREAEREVAKAAQPLIDNLRMQAEAAAEQLLELYADLWALCIATKSSDQVSTRLQYVAAEITRERLLLPRSEFPVSDAIRSIDPALSGKGAAFDHRYPVAKKAGPPQARLLPPMGVPRS